MQLSLLPMITGSTCENGLLIIILFSNRTFPRHCRSPKMINRLEQRHCRLYLKFGIGIEYQQRIKRRLLGTCAVIIRQCKLEYCWSMLGRCGVVGVHFFCVRFNDSDFKRGKTEMLLVGFRCCVEFQFVVSIESHYVMMIWNWNEGINTASMDTTQRLGFILENRNFPSVGRLFFPLFDYRNFPPTFALGTFWMSHFVRFEFN